MRYLAFYSSQILIRFPNPSGNIREVPLNPEVLKGITPPDRRAYVLKLPASCDAGDVSRRLRENLQYHQMRGRSEARSEEEGFSRRILKKYGPGYGPSPPQR